MAIRSVASLCQRGGSTRADYESLSDRGALFAGTMKHSFRIRETRSALAQSSPARVDGKKS
jgi:hypothetical protein